MDQDERCHAVSVEPCGDASFDECHNKMWLPYLSLLVSGASQAIDRISGQGRSPDGNLRFDDVS